MPEVKLKVSEPGSQFKIIKRPRNVEARQKRDARIVTMRSLHRQSLEEIAASVRRTKQRISQILTEQGQTHINVRTVQAAENRRRAVKMFERGKITSEIARGIGVSVNAIGDYFKRELEPLGIEWQRKMQERREKRRIEEAKCWVDKFIKRHQRLPSHSEFHRGCKAFYKKQRQKGRKFDAMMKFLGYEVPPTKTYNLH